MGHPAGASELSDQRGRPVDANRIAHEAYEYYGAAQRELELIEAVRQVAEIQPKVIVEIGCDRGGTLYCWRQLGADVYGITLPGGINGGQEGYPLNDHGAVIHLGNSHRPETLQWLIDQFNGRPIDALHIDGDHCYLGVKADWDMYSPLVRIDGLVLIHDVLNTYQPWVQVPLFWQELTADRPDSTRLIAAPRSPLGFGVVTI